MTLAELTAEVVTLTGRPDRTAEILTAIKAATLKMHHSDFYWKDLLECGVQFPVASFIQDLEYRTYIPLYRAAKYLRKIDVTTNPATPGKMLDLVVPENIFDSYKIEKQDIFYAAGSYLHINSSTKEDFYLLGAYINPEITEAGYDSWVAVDHPYAIVFEAARSVFKMIGKDEEAAGMDALAREQMAILQRNNVVANGY